MNRKMRVGWWLLVMGIMCLVLTSGMTCKKHSPPLSFTATFGRGGDDEGYSVQQTTDGGFVIAGSTESYTSGGSGAWLVKVDAWGNQVWQHAFGWDEDYDYSVQQTSDGGYIIAGMNNSNGEDCCGWLIKTDSSGRRVWDRVYLEDGTAGGFAVRQTSDGGYIVTGYVAPFESTVLWLLRTDVSGNAMWDTTYDDVGSMGFSVQQTSDGGFIVAGEGGAADLLLRTDASGNVVWNRTYASSGDNAGHSVEQTLDGGYVMAGWTNTSGAGQHDVWLVKCDSSGDAVWTRTFGGTGDDEAYSVKQTSDGGYIVTGFTKSYGAGGSDVWLIKTDSSGREVWDRTFGGPNDDEGWSVQQTTDGGFIVTGTTFSYGAGSGDVWLIKTDADGN